MWTQWLYQSLVEESSFWVLFFLNSIIPVHWGLNGFFWSVDFDWVIATPYFFSYLEMMLWSRYFWDHCLFRWCSCGWALAVKLIASHLTLRSSWWITLFGYKVNTNHYSFTTCAWQLVWGVLQICCFWLSFNVSLCFTVKVLHFGVIFWKFCGCLYATF